MSSLTDVVTVLLLMLADDVVLGSAVPVAEEAEGSGSRYDSRSMASTQFSGSSCRHETKDKGQVSWQFGQRKLDLH